MISIDLDNTMRIFSGSADENYGRIYAQTNEYLKQLYSNIDFREKNVFSVAASGDHALLAYANGATHVDIFDRNKLTLYYYYLRLWTLKYYNQFYPRIPLDKNYISEILHFVKVESSEEQKAFDYWSKLLDLVDSSMLDSLFFYEGAYLENMSEDVIKINNSVERDNFSFQNIDISCKMNLQKKYDIVVVSNIFDWLLLKNNLTALETYRDNLYNLLNDGGIVLSSNVGSSGASKSQRIIFEKNFEYYKLPDFYFYKWSTTPGFIFKKK